MQFEVCRISHGWADRDTKPPCPGAYTAEHQYPNQKHVQWYIDINTLEELVKLSIDVDNPLVVTANRNSLPEIEVYDDYRE